MLKFTNPVFLTRQLSFSELKKRQKKRQNEAKAAEKAAKKAAEAEAKAAAKANQPKKQNLAAAFDEEEKDPSKYTENRKNFVQSLRDQNINPYPHKFTRTHRIDEFRAEYLEKTTDNTFLEDQDHKLEGGKTRANPRFPIFW